MYFTCGLERCVNASPLAYLTRFFFLSLPLSLSSFGKINFSSKLRTKQLSLRKYLISFFFCVLYYSVIQSSAHFVRTSKIFSKFFVRSSFIRMLINTAHCSRLRIYIFSRCTLPSLLTRNLVERVMIRYATEVASIY